MTKLKILIFLLFFLFIFFALNKTFNAVSLTPNNQLKFIDSKCLQMHSYIKTNSNAAYKYYYAENAVNLFSEDQTTTITFYGLPNTDYMFDKSGIGFTVRTNESGIAVKSFEISEFSGMLINPFYVTNITNSINCGYLGTLVYMKPFEYVSKTETRSNLQMSLSQVFTADSDYKIAVNFQDFTYLDWICITVGRTVPVNSSGIGNVLRKNVDGTYSWISSKDNSECITTFDSSIDGILDISDLKPYFDNSTSYYIKVKVKDKFSRYSEKYFPFGVKNLSINQTPLFRFYSTNNKAHFYTSSPIEQFNTAISYTSGGWQYEGVAYGVSDCSDAGSSMVYRFWSAQNKKHFYTNSPEEKQLVIDKYTDNEWLYEGEVFCAYGSQVAGSNPVYRFWSAQNKSHFYTSSEQEKQEVVDKYTDNEWLLEGVAYYVK